MSDLADRLKRRVQQQAKEQQGEETLRTFQERVNSFISDHARREYEQLQVQLKALIDQVNPAINNLPPFQFTQGSGMIQQGNCVAFIHFDKPIVNQPHNQLMISFGPHPNNMYFEEPPAPIRYRLHAAATDSLDGIVWVGDLGELTTARLCDFILENLTDYYLEHKPGQ